MRYSKDYVKNERASQSSAPTADRFAQLPKGLPYPKHAMTQMTAQLLKVLNARHQQAM